MAQKSLMRILSRKDGKGTISDNRANERIKLTKVLEFVPARKPEQAKVGGLVRFHYRTVSWQHLGTHCYNDY